MGYAVIRNLNTGITEVFGDKRQAFRDLGLRASGKSIAPDYDINEEYDPETEMSPSEKAARDAYYGNTRGR